MPKKSPVRGSRRRSTRLNKTVTEEGDAQPKADKVKLEEKQEDDNEEEKEVVSDSDDSEAEEEYVFEGKHYATYYEMVLAKRKRNEEIMREKGLLTPLSTFIPTVKKEASQNGIKRRKKVASEQPKIQRKSKRLAGTPADGRYIEHEGAGNFVIAAENGGSVTQTTSMVAQPQKRITRINGGSPLSVHQAVEHCEPKWLQEGSAESASSFVAETLKPLLNANTKERRKNKSTSRSPTSVVASDPTNAIRNQIQQLSVDNDDLVAKVTPERIFSVAAHPSKQSLIVCAGDKLGYVGMWNVDKSSDDAANDGVNLFRFHTRPVNTLNWTSQGLISSSYDGTVRYFDVAKESVEEIFSSDENEHNFYTQYLCLDHRTNDHSFFLSTSIGSVFHVDRRAGKGRGSVTFNADLSEKKINSIRYVSYYVIAKRD